MREAPSLSATTAPPARSAEEIRNRRKRDVALGYRLFAAQRWGDLGDGHISARDPERLDCFWMLRYGVSYHEATVADLVLVGPGGDLVGGEGVINIAGYYIHHPILAARPDAVSAAHVHTVWGTPFAVILRNHGLLTVGDSVSEAVGLFVHLERVAEAHMKARHARPISADAARYGKADLTRHGAGRVGFHALVTRHIGDRSVVE